MEERIPMPHSLTGVVVHGKQLGRTLGFPTANINPIPGMRAAEQNGVWIGAFSLPEWRTSLPCMINQGKHPTAPEGAPTIEAYILDFSDDIYGRIVRLDYLQFLRSEVRFNSLEALKAQLEIDCRAVRAYFEAHK